MLLVLSNGGSCGLDGVFVRNNVLWFFSGVGTGFDGGKGHFVTWKEGRLWMESFFILLRRYKLWDRFFFWLMRRVRMSTDFTRQ